MSYIRREVSDVRLRSIFVRAPEGVNRETIAILYDALIEL